MLNPCKKILLLFISLLLVGISSYGQCFRVLDGNGVFTNNNPQWVNCTPGSYTLILQTNNAIGPYTINWGDGNSGSGTDITPPAFIQHTYPNTTNTFNVTLTETGTGCTINGLVVLERNPLASIQLPAGDDNFGCTPVQFRFINSSTQISSTTSFTWDFGDGSPVLNFGAGNLGDTINHTYLPGIGVQSCDLEVTLEATNFCGTSTASFFPLKVWDLDEARITPSATLQCFPDNTFQFTNSTIRNCYPEGNNSQRYEFWNFGDYWGKGYDSIINWRPWNPPIINPPPIEYPGVGTYSVTLIDSSYCGTDATTISVTITSAPTAVITSNKDTICAGESVTFMNGSFGGGNTYRWNFDQGSGWQNLNGNNKTRTFNNPGDYRIGLIVGVNGANGCRDTAFVDLYVNPSPTTDFTLSNNNQCDSMIVNFTNTTTGAVFWRWTFGNGNTFVGQNPPAQNYTSPGAYTVKLYTENNSGCPDSVSKTVNVYQTPVPAFLPASVCVNAVASFMDQSTTAPGDPVLSWFWDFGNGSTSTIKNPTTVFTSGGTYNIILQVSTANCTARDTIPIVVESLPTAGFTPSPNAGCSKLGVAFSNTSSPNATKFKWNFGDGSPIDTNRSPVHEYVNTSSGDTSFIVTLIASTTFGCSDTISDTIDVFPVPSPDFTSDAVVDCGPITVNFTNLTVGDSLSYIWNFGDGTALSTDTNPTHVFDNKTLFISNYNVQLVVLSKNGCRDTTTKVITVNPEPIFNFTTLPDSGCSPLRVQFPVVVGAVSYQWDFGDGNTSVGANPTHLYVNNTTNNQTFNIRLIATNSFGCSDTSYGDVLVYPNPTSIFTTDTIRGCQPLPIEFTNSSTGANFYNWSFGDGTSSDTSDAIFTKIFTNTTAAIVNRTVRLITSTNQGCKDTAITQIEVYPKVEAQFLSDTAGCTPFPVSFTNQSIGASGYQWSFGDGGSSTLNAPNHLFVNPLLKDTIYQVKLIATSPQMCVDSQVNNILIYPKPVADYTIDQSVGCHPLIVNYSNNSLIADSCRWDWGDGTFNSNCFSANSHTFNNTTSSLPINYYTNLFVFTDNGCKDTLRKTITVNPDVIAAFTADTVGCSPFPVRFSNSSTGAANYHWEFGDGTSSSAVNPSHTYINSGLTDTIFYAKLLVGSPQACLDSVTIPIRVHPKPIADYTLGNNLGCHPFEVNFTNTSLIADSCRWSWGDGTFDDTCFITKSHIYTNTTSSLPLTYAANLYVFTNQGCKDTIRKTITVNPDIIADFSVDTIGCSPHVVRFNNSSSGAAGYNWDFGDGTSSIAVNPNHTYVNTGLIDTIFEAKLVVRSPQGCTDSMIVPIRVHPKPIADYSIDKTIGCHPLEVNYTNTSSIADSCSWVWGDGTFNDTCFVSSSHTFSNTTSSAPITYATNLYVFSDKGCKDTLRRTVTVNPQVIADFTVDTVGCSPLKATFNNSSVGGASFQWLFGDGVISNSSNPNHIYINYGQIDTIYNAKLIVRSPQQCIDSLDYDILVHPKPIADFVASTTGGCQPLEVQFTNQSTSNDSCSWVYGDGNSLNNCNINTNHTYFNQTSLVPISYPTELRVYTNFGCADTLDQIFTVNPQVIADYSFDTIGCSPFPVTFRSQSFGAISYQWDFDDGATSQGLIANHTFVNTSSRDTVFNVQLIANSVYNCKDTVVNPITVRATPIPDFVANPITQLFPNSTVNLINNTNAGPWNYNWSFGDTTFSTVRSPGSHVYNYWGKYKIWLKASTPFCSDSVFREITIIAPVPVAEFNDSITGCEPLEVTFQNQSIYANQYIWDFGDGSSSSQKNPTYTYRQPGIFNVSLKAIGDGGEDIEVKNNYVEVYRRANANFTINKGPDEKIFIPNDPLVTINYSINADSYLWDFGDGNTSTERNPTHYYTKEGTFPIFLIAETSFGCNDTFDLGRTVIAELQGSIRVPNAFTPNPSGPGTGQVKRNPGFGELNDVFYALIVGAETYELNIFNKWGELLFVSKDQEIGWDGYYKGELCKQDTYVWKVKATFADGETVVKTGDLLLLR